MANKRRQNWLNQVRVNTPDLRAVESAVSNDFDDLLNSLVLGENKSYVLRGFEIDMTTAIGGAANGLQLLVEDSSIFHGKSAESGTFSVVPSGTSPEIINSTSNSKVEGAFTPSALNYVGLEYTRGVDDSTVGQVYLWNPTSKVEITKTLPLAIVFDYKIVVSSSIFASNILPIAIVETDASNNVINIQDNRPMLFRLGAGGSNTPDPFYSYPWNNHAEGRTENYYKSSTTTSPFRGGDKQITNLKELMDAHSTSIKEIQGTVYWYQKNPAGSIHKLRADLAHTQITGSGKITHSAITPGQMNWDNDFYMDFVGSRLSYKIQSNGASADIILADNQVAYVKLVRDQPIIPNLIFTNGSAIVTSVGAISWTNDILAGDFIKLKTSNDTLYYEVLSIDTASQVTLTEAYQEVSTGSIGADANYAYGSYLTDPAPSTDRHIKVSDRRLVPFDADTYWLFLRSDKGSSIAKVYMRGASGGEIEQGESRQISDNTTQEILEYIGSPAETDSTPDFTNSIATYLPEQTKFSFGPASGITTGQSFNINSASNIRKYYVWANIAAAGGNPLVPGRIGVEVTLSGSENAIQVAAAYHSAIDAVGDFNSTDNLDGSITVENSQVGASDNSTNNDLAGLTILITQDGLGKANCAVIDNENLTKSTKRLDEKVCDILEALDTKIYREKMSVVSGVPANDNEIQGPIAINDIISIPLNSHDSNIQPEYTVGSDVLEFLLNGHIQCNGADYTEVGAAGSLSTTIQVLIPLSVGDELEFRFKEGSGGASGTDSATGVNLGPIANADIFKQVVGSQFQFRRITAGSGVTITEGSNDVNISVAPATAPKSVVHAIADYTVQSTDDVILATNSGSDITITLPSATSAGKEISIKKIAVGNTMFIKTVGGQLLDGTDADATPLGITVTNESITVITDGTSWFII